MWKSDNLCDFWVNFDKTRSGVSPKHSWIPLCFRDFSSGSWALLLAEVRRFKTADLVSNPSQNIRIIYIYSIYYIHIIIIYPYVLYIRIYIYMYQYLCSFCGKFMCRAGSLAAGRILGCSPRMFTKPSTSYYLPKLSIYMWQQQDVTCKLSEHVWIWGKYHQCDHIKIN